MKKVITILSVLFLFACTVENKTTINEHINLIITPDLSNRIEDLYLKPVSDITLITSIYNNYYPALYKIKNRVLGQEDVVQFKFTNPSIITDFKINLNNLRMDLSIMNPAERIEFLANGGNKDMLKILDKEVNNLYVKAKQNSTGGDLFNYFKSEITSTVIRRTENPIVMGGITVINKQRNIIVLLTDGYIEAGLYGEKNCRDKKCFYLSKKKVNQFRKDFLASGNNDLKDFFTKSGYGIIPIKNKNLENTEVFVSEMYDRSLNRITGSQTVSPNDFEIMKLFWSDWFKKSGVKRHQLLDVANSKEEFLLELKKFIEEG